MFQKQALSLCLFLFCSEGFAQTTIPAKAQLSQATIYRKGATLQHRVPLVLAKGRSEIVVSNIANQIDEKSIQLSLPTAVNLLSVRFQKESEMTNAIPGKDSLDRELSKWQKELRAIKIKEEAEQNTLNMIKTYVEDVEPGKDGLSVDELVKLANYYKQQSEQSETNLETIRAQYKVVFLKMQAIQKLMLSPEENPSRIVLELMSSRPINGSMELSYLTPEAAWSPSYDFRVDKTRDGLTLIQKANIVQNTGFDWKQVRLNLSTGNPTEGNTVPELKAWFLQYAQNSIAAALAGYAPGILVTTGSGQPGTQSDLMLRGSGSLSATNAPLIVLDGAPYSGALSAINPLDILDVEVLKDATATAVYGARASNGVMLVNTKRKGNNGIGDFTLMSDQLAFDNYEISIPYDILSGNKTQLVEIREMNKAVDFSYLAIPKMDPDVFLVAQLSHFDSLNLLPGMYNTIYENRYVGQSFVNPMLSRDTLNIGLGRDKRILVKREKVAEKSYVKTSGSTKKQTFTFEIQIRNTKSEVVSLIVKDQIPVSNIDKIEVLSVETGSGVLDKESGILTWNLRMAANESTTLRFSYTIKSQLNESLSL